VYLDLWGSNDSGADSTDNITNLSSVYVYMVDYNHFDRQTITWSWNGDSSHDMGSPGALNEGQNYIYASVIYYRRVSQGFGVYTYEIAGSETASIEVYKDSIANAPSGLYLYHSDDTGSSSTDNLTSATTDLTISGSGEDGATVTLFDDLDDDGAVDADESLGTATVASGSFSLDVALAEGTHSVKAVQTDVAGNASVASAALSITVDATAPDAPTGLDLAAGDDAGSSSTDNVTSATTGLTISGSGEDDATVTLFDDLDDDGAVDSGESLGTATVASGSFSLDVALAEGTHSVKAVQTDAAGNASAASVALSITVETPTSTATGGGDSGTSPTTTATTTNTTLGGSLTASLPAGVSATSSSSTGDAAAASSTLNSSISRSSLSSADKAAASSALTGFTSSLPAGSSVTVSTVTLTSTDSTAETITITGSTSGNEAMVIDVSALPKGSVIKLDNVEFAVIVGAVSVTGGAGQNQVTGDGSAQYIVLGPEDDILAGGGGDDYVGSLGGNDRLSGNDGNDTVSGGADNDVLHGNAGNDSLDGGNGVDVAMFGVSRASATLTGSTVSGEGTDSLTNVELLAFTDGITLSNTQLTSSFDEALYLAQNSDVAAAVASGLFASGAQHFALYGAAEGRDPNALFNAAWYLEQNPDVAAMVASGKTTAWTHYQTYGWKEGRGASMYFDTSAYLAQNQDVAITGINPLDHFLIWGAAEGRLAQAATAGASWLL